MLVLKDAGVPVDLRIYGKGGHIFRMQPTEDPVIRRWPQHRREWLKDVGVL